MPSMPIFEYGQAWPATPNRPASTSAHRREPVSSSATRKKNATPIAT